VKIAVHACGVNFPDTLIIQNKYQFKPPLPFAPGGEVAGEVIEAGPGVKRFRKGDRVIAMVGFGGYADELVAEEAMVMPVPASMDYVTASGSRWSTARRTTRSSSERV
jgi:NADPH2:quinone reductase